MTERRSFTCIGCPMGCGLTAEIDGADIRVSGQGCKIGETYGINECVDPRRTLTASVRLKKGVTLAVKTAPDIPKSRVFDCIAEIKKLEESGALVGRSFQIGDVVIKDILGLGSDAVVTRSL